MANLTTEQKIAFLNKHRPDLLKDWEKYKTLFNLNNETNPETLKIFIETFKEIQIEKNNWRNT